MSEAARRAVFGWSGFALAQAGLWLCYAGQVDTYEVVGAVVGSGLATGAVAVVAHASPVRGWPMWPDVARLWRMPWDVLTGLGSATKALWRKVSMGEEGEMVVECYAPAARAGTRVGVKHDRGRQILLEAFVSVTPSSVVLGKMGPGRRMLVHQVVRGAEKPGLIAVMRRPKAKAGEVRGDA